MTILAPKYQPTASPRRTKNAPVAGAAGFYRPRNWAYPGRRTFVKSYGPTGEPSLAKPRRVVRTVVSTAEETLNNINKAYFPNAH